MARAATSDELIALRSDNQWSRLFLAMHKPVTVYTARLASLPSSNDIVLQIAFTSGSGTLGDVKEGMVLLVGTTAGARDLGTCRLRKAPIAGTFYIGAKSNISWQASCYLTVLDWMRFERRDPVLSSGALLMDGDIAYSDQHVNFDPCPNLGPDAVVTLEGAYVDVPFSAAPFVFDSTISAYSWSVYPATGVTITGGTTATPSFRFTIALGHQAYRVSCLVTAATGKSVTAHRRAFIFDEDNPPYTAILKDCGANIDEGGWSFEVEMDADATLTEVCDNALVVLFAKDYYGNVEQSIGPVSGRENIITYGWIENEPIDWNPRGGKISFRVQGPAYWAKQMQCNDFLQEITLGVPVNWEEMQNLTVDKAAFHLLHWRSTFTRICDFYKSGDTNFSPKFESPTGSLWDQLSQIGQKVLAFPGCDRYRRLYLEIEPQAVAEASRTWPVVQTLAKNDWMNEINFSRIKNTPNGVLYLAGWVVQADGTAITLYSISPGHVAEEHGRSDIIDGLLLSDQTQSNDLCGLIQGWKNNPYGPFDIELASNHRLIDLWPRQKLTISIAEEDTPRGISYSGNLIPRDIAITHDKTGFLHTIIQAEAETLPEPAINGDIPNGDGTFDDFPEIEPLGGLSPFPDDSIIPGGEITVSNRFVIHCERHGMLVTENFDAANPSWDYVTFFLNVRNMLVTPSGAVFVHNSADEIWVASSEQGGYTRILTAADLATAFGSGAGIKAMGYNPNMTESVMLIIWRNATNLSGTMIGDSSGFAKGESGYTFDDDTNFLTTKRNDMLAYGGGAWAYVFGCNFPGASQRHQIRRFTAEGVHMDTDPLNISSTEDVTGEGHIFRLGTSGTILMWERNDDYFAILEDNGNGSITSHVPPAQFRGSHTTLAATLDGQYVMAHFTGGSAGEIRTSSDGGANWSSPLTMPSGFWGPSYIICIDADRWIVTGISNGTSNRKVVLYTDDFGVTWIDKSGNIANIFPSPDYASVDFIQVLP